MLPVLMMKRPFRISTSNRSRFRGAGPAKVLPNGVVFGTVARAFETLRGATPGHPGIPGGHNVGTGPSAPSVSTFLPANCSDKESGCRHYESLGFGHKKWGAPIRPGAKTLRCDLGHGARSSTSDPKPPLSLGQKKASELSPMMPKKEKKVAFSAC